ncbi:MAG: RNA methyltransferase, partial [Rhodococcus sp. (in: high G+C Gram-positive bacteria)]|nr:RNA methyltransferase [Rhodococcus sp. (in: high G+C Gram-positive bacteria)]
VPVEVNEPGNAGTVIRIADAVGADAAILAGDSVDPHNGKVVRSSAGSLFHLPVVRDRDTVSVIEQIHAAGIQILATAADGEVDLDEADELLSKPTAWLFGNEAHGLDPAIAAQADHRVRIPIHGRAESLNLATAAAICLYASARVQNRATDHG